MREAQVAGLIHRVAVDRSARHQLVPQDNRVEVAAEHSDDICSRECLLLTAKVAREHQRVAVAAVETQMGCRLSSGSRPAIGIVAVAALATRAGPPN